MPDPPASQCDVLCNQYITMTGSHQRFNELIYIHEIKSLKRTRCPYPDKCVRPQQLPGLITVASVPPLPLLKNLVSGIVSLRIISWRGLDGAVPKGLGLEGVAASAATSPASATSTAA